MTAPDTADDAPDPNALKFRALREDLHRRYDHALAARDIDRILDELISEHTETAKIRTFIPIIVEREATEEIENLAWLGGAHTRRREILFVCRHNTGRSQIASVIARHLAGEQALFRSVGPEPRAMGNPEIIRQLQERGYDTSLIYPKQLTSRTIYESDVVVLIGPEELRDYQGRATETWDVADPEGMDAAGVAGVIEEIEGHVRALLDRQKLPVAG
ncbi:arsenate-mycothiol transferase ArsC [Corynebacterium guangdongense]|uniref:Protein-tyrosine-phosphatase n=1 Tax=Corynebacterium guangdongense TaxID=1783348 RepID=A0ABU2A1I6_9CORY|nr:low molecular weight phosphatase family protein [Corynebacterium guangdongense]MDR7330463.1 protein-tyrosine-phosphatase [Corynebacterium guangdongense]WJZ19021.1 Arsenate-mycothiol transferase ArsC2 [Corynebacterium guangdongense]